MKLIKRGLVTKVLWAVIVAMIAANLAFYLLKLSRPVELRLCEGIVLKNLTVPKSYSRGEVSRNARDGKAFVLTIQYDAADRSGRRTGGLAACEFNGESDAVYGLPVVTKVQINGEEVQGLAIFDSLVRSKVANSWR